MSSLTKIDLTSLQFLGVPTAPTASPGNNTTQLATTAFVTNAVASATTGVSSWNTRTGAVTITLGDITGVGGAPLTSPVFVGVPTAPTAATGTNTTQLATTAFAANAVLGGVSAGVHINTLTSSPLVGDGVTSNTTQLGSLAPVMQGIGQEFPVQVTITIGTPTVITLNTLPGSGNTLTDNTHFLKPNQAFYFIVSAGGSLPTGISLNTLYYVTSANLTATTFTFSATNNYGFIPGTSTLTTEGPTVNTTGSLTGTASIVLTGRDVSIYIPPGAYFCGVYGSPVLNQALVPNGMTRVRWLAYGAMFDTKTTLGTISSSSLFMGDAATWASNVFDYVNTTPNELGVPLLDAQITLQTVADAVNYKPRQWITIFGLDIQNSYGNFDSGPANNHYQEYKQIKSVNTSTGVLTLDGPLKGVYLSTFPNMFNQQGKIGGGPALIARMHPSWDCDIEIRGARWVGQSPAQNARRIILTDCVFQGYQDFPGVAQCGEAQYFVFRHCQFGYNCGGSQGLQQVDKMLEYLEFDHCFAPNQYSINFISTSLQNCLVKSHQGSQIHGTPRNIRITDSILEAFEPGPFIGVTDGCEVHNSRISYFDMASRIDDPVTGTIPRPGDDMTLVPNWTFLNGTFTRNLTGLTGHQGMDWQIPGAKFYLIDASNTYKYYQNMGSPFTILNVYMDGSGNFSFDTTLDAIPSRQTSAAVTLTIASPGVVNWNNHGLPANTPVCFTVGGTGAALPTGLSVSTIYWVSAPTTNSFNVSATSGGGAINFTGTQSGVVTAYGNPLCFRVHPCARFTGINNTGSTILTDLNGAIDEPLFSRVKRSFVGKVNNLVGEPANFQVPNPRIWGFLTSMIVTVRQAGSAGTLNVSCPGFTQPNLALSTFSQTIDITQVGKRIVTPTSVTGTLGADALTTYVDWIAGPLVFNFSNTTTFVGGPVVEFEMYTDQGITRFNNMWGAPALAGSTFLWTWNDSGIQSQYGTTP